jgi:hypothetical protein
MSDPGGQLPCLSCRHPQAAQARREVIEIYMAVRQGRTPPPPATPGVLPDACCRRRKPEIEAMVA